MKKHLHSFLYLVITFTVISAPAFSQEGRHSEGKYTLNFFSGDTTFDKGLCKKLIETFFTVYPNLAERFNKNTSTTVTFFIDPGYEGVAATYNDTVSFNPKWFLKNPGDIDVVTHEVMHIVQAYPEESGPWWVTEGIADYARYKFGVDNAGGNWALPDIKPDHKYDSSYRITARFLAWLENHMNKNIVDELDRSMRSGTYSDDIWEKLTGKSVEELWTAYAGNPEL